MDKELVEGLLVHAGLSGIYCVLFGLSMYIHLKKRTSGLWIHLVTMSALFVLAIVGFFCAASDVISEYIISPRTSKGTAAFYYEDLALRPLGTVARAGTALSAVVRGCYIFSNLIADSYITYRCYIVWGRSKRVIILPGILIIATLVCQITPWYDYFEGAGYYIGVIGGLSLTVATNLIMTALTAGRIWWIGRQTNLAFGRRMQSGHQRTIQVILESGLLYPVILLALVIQWACRPENAPSINVIIAVNLCIVNIAPTLIVIRVGLGVSSDTMVTTLRTSNDELYPSDDTLPYDSGNGAGPAMQYGLALSSDEKV